MKANECVAIIVQFVNHKTSDREVTSYHVDRQARMRMKVAWLASLGKQVLRERERERA
jgi:hypothetical protein